jgi:hypothetical protein
MVSLVDIGPARKEITLRGQKVEMRALSMTFLTGLLRDSTELQALLAEKKIDGNIAMVLIANLPDMVAHCIAAASGKPGDAETVGFILLELSPGEWLTCLEAIIPLTFPQGVKSFVDALFQAGRSLGLDVSGWEQAMNSPEPSPASSIADTLPRPLGNIAPDKSTPGTNSTEEKDTQSS